MNLTISIATLEISLNIYQPFRFILPNQIAPIYHVAVLSPNPASGEIYKMFPVSIQEKHPTMPLTVTWNTDIHRKRRGQDTTRCNSKFYWYALAIVTSEAEADDGDSQTQRALVRLRFHTIRTAGSRHKIKSVILR